MAYTFKGGIHVAEHKNTAGAPIEKMPAPATVSIPLSQHIGKPCDPVVAPGDTVLRGQVIGDVNAGLGCPVHASVSGTVLRIDETHTATGAAVRSIVIESDGLDTPSPDIKPCEKPISELSAAELIDIVRSAGISGMGGATFPTYAKIQSALDKVDRLIINCAECEPYITANHRLMLESPESVVNGAKILLKAFGLRLAEIAVEDNKPDAIALLRALCADSELVRVRVMKTKYPQGDERQLIFALTGKELPMGKLPADVGCVVFNCETASAIYNAVAHGMPLIERVVTVDGECVANPKNVLAPIGTSYKDLIDFCGGLVDTPYKLISGGPMMGFAQWDINAPVTKGTSAILVLPKPKSHEIIGNCIRCGRCVAGCPMHLMPSYVAMFSAHGDYDEAERYGAANCVECGSCSYNCPGHVPIVQFIRVAKGNIQAKRALERAAKAAQGGNAK